MQKLTTRAARAYVIEIASKALRKIPQYVRRRGGGLTNLVYQVDVDDRSVIVRVNVDPAKLKVLIANGRRWHLHVARGYRYHAFCMLAPIPIHS